MTVQIRKATVVGRIHCDRNGCDTSGDYRVPEDTNDNVKANVRRVAAVNGWTTVPIPPIPGLTNPYYEDRCPRHPEGSTPWPTTSAPRSKHRRISQRSA